MPEIEVHMRIARPFAVLAACGALAAAPCVLAQDAFDACTVFTQDDAEKALGTAAAGEPANPKVKRPKVVPACTYNGSKEGKPVAASVLFKFGRTNDEAAKMFEEARLQFQTKPMLISGAEAFWSGKTGQMHLRKGRTWVALSVGPAKVNEREIEQAKKLAEILVKKL
jgi:hypothetical protein